MQRLFFGIATAVALSAAPAAAEDRLVSPALDGYVVGYEAGNEVQTIREEVPRGETVESWSAMVTTQRFAIEAPDIARFAPAFLDNLKAACPAATFVEPTLFDHHGDPAVLFSAACPNSPATGGKEVMSVLAMTRGDAVFVKQVAFRGHYEGDPTWAIDFLLATRLCDGACSD